MIARRALRARDSSSGFTLVELLIAVTLSIVILGAMVGSFMLVLRTAVGLSTDPSVVAQGAQNEQLVAAQVDASESVQELSRWFTADIENAAGYDRVAAPGTMPCTTVAPAPAKGAAVLLSVEQYDRTGAAHLVAYAYSEDAAKQDGRITRYECTAATTAAAGTATPVSRVLATNLSTKSADRPTVSRSQRSATLTVVALTGRRYTLDASVRLQVALAYPVLGSGATAAPSPTPSPTPSLEPVRTPITAVLMLDTDTNGFVDKFEVQFDGTATTACLDLAAWSITDAPSNGRLTRVQGPAGRKRIELSMEAGAGSSANTAVGSARLSFTSPTGCNIANLDSGEPADKAPPVLIAYTEPSETAPAGMMAVGDAASLAFSEPLASGYPTTTTVTVTDGGGGAGNPKNDLLAMPGFSDGSLSMGSGTYFVPGTGQSPVTVASFPAAVTAPSPGTLLIKLQGTCSGCSWLRSSSGPFTFLPSPALKDVAGNTALPAATATPVQSPWEIF